jgi:hypothetical protein
MQMLVYDLPDIDAFKGLPPENAELLWTDYSEEEARNIMAALQFAVDNPDFDFAALEPQLNRSNAEIHTFLCKIHTSVCLAAEARARASH